MWAMEDTRSSSNVWFYDSIECGLLTMEELNLIENIGNNIETVKAEVGDINHELNTKIRDTNISWLPIDRYEWLYRKMTDFLNHVNSTMYRFDVSYMEMIQYSIYKENQHYKAHIDMQPSTSLGNTHRKISFSLQLTNEMSYDGGDLLYFNGSKEEGDIMPRKRGMISVFPSFLLHQVTPVTRGERRCLVGWVNGPRFK